MVSCRFSLHHSIDSCIIYVFLACEVSRRTLVLDYFHSTLAMSPVTGRFGGPSLCKQEGYRPNIAVLMHVLIGVDDDDDDHDHDPLDGRCMVCSIFGRPERKPSSNGRQVWADAWQKITWFSPLTKQWLAAQARWRAGLRGTAPHDAASIATISSSYVELLIREKIPSDCITYILLW